MKNKEFIQFRKKMQEALREDFGVNRAPFWGNQRSKIVSISQAPSQSVVKTQKPFWDKSGERLRKVWYKVSDEVFYNPDNFYFTAIAMYFPGKDKKGGDRKPTFDWASQWLIRELSFLKPKLYLVLGRVAAEFFYPGKSFEGLVFNDQKLNGILALVLPHPSPINIKWFKDHPDFETKRLPIIKEYIAKVLKDCL